jgi:hypothetical protein
LTIKSFILSLLLILLTLILLLMNSIVKD